MYYSEIILVKSVEKRKYYYVGIIIHYRKIDTENPSYDFCILSKIMSIPKKVWRKKGKPKKRALYECYNHPNNPSFKKWRLMELYEIKCNIKYNIIWVSIDNYLYCFDKSLINSRFNEKIK